jgi:N-alpha-acetyltransferase 15/16, NatA auxiliary subunit
MQLRHFDQLVETRQILLKNRVNVRQSWAAMAIAYHLNGQLESATKVLELYERTVKDIPPYDPEHSEFLLYHITILEEMGSHSEALNLLDVSAKSRSITDRSMISIFRGTGRRWCHSARFLC